jgi:regulator of protease activity HflC (stomatin/prohibitin superfamily)
MFVIGLLVGLCSYGLYLATRCSFRVDEGHVGVVTTFGAAQFDSDGKRTRLVTQAPGLHFKWPWQHVQLVSMMEQNLELSGETGGQRAMAHDGTMLRFDSILRYEPDPARLHHFLFGMKAPIEHITSLFSCLLRNEIANFQVARAPKRALAPAGSEGAILSARDFDGEAGSYAQIRRERALLNERIEEFCRERIGDYYGLRFNAVDLIDILPPDELAEALNAVFNARAEAEAHYFRAEGTCQQRVLSASEGVEIASSRARAVETEIDKLGEFLSELAETRTLDAYVKRRRVEVHSEARALFVKEEMR